MDRVVLPTSLATDPSLDRDYLLTLFLHLLSDLQPYPREIEIACGRPSPVFASCPPGTLVLTYNRLCARYGVHRTTLMRRIERLRAAGLLNVHHRDHWTEIEVYNWEQYAHPDDLDGAQGVRTGRNLASMHDPVDLGDGGRAQGGRTGQTAQESLSLSPPPAAKRKKAALPASQSHHPAIQAVRSVAARYPDKVLWPSMIETLGEAPDVERLRECYLAWRTHGYNPTNWSWVTEWYRDGVPPNLAGNNGARRPARGTMDAAVSRVLEKIEQAERRHQDDAERSSTGGDKGPRALPFFG